MTTKNDIGDRFTLKTRKAANGCILWTASQGGGGYGNISYMGKVRRAHRVSFELFIGPIPKGLDVLHDCPGGDNPLCVNPLHLWLGNDADNVADCHRKGRAASKVGLLNGRSMLTPEMVKEIRTLSSRGYTQVSLSKIYGVCES